ncbi:MAG: zf-TFIIB domain-containing protein [Candidatus Krumholzibacteriia bacterium]
MWFDASELALLFENHDDLTDDAIARLPDAATDEKRRRCPHCRRHLRKVNIGDAEGVLIDACPDGHGVFFDRGEVADLARHIAAASDDLPRRVLVFLGATFRCDAAANETETP